MSKLEELATELEINIDWNKENGAYTGIAGALASVVAETLLNDNEIIYELSWDKQKDLIIQNFRRLFQQNEGET